MVDFLHHTPSDIVRRLLIDLGVGSDPASNLPWPIFESSEPDVPDEVITIFGEKGKTYGRNQLTGETIEKPGIQFRVRSSISNIAAVKANEIAATVDQMILNSVVVMPDSSYVYVVENVNRAHGIFSFSGNVVPLGKSSPSTPGVTSPSSVRNIFIINALVSIRNQ